MLPAQRNKVDVSKLTAAEQQAFRLYGKLPSRPVAKSQERKYFDSGDWALSKAGKQKGEYGKEIPTPDAIPHASPSPLVGGVSTPGGSSGTPGVGSPGSGISGMMSPPSSSSGIGLGPASSTSPPGSFVIGNTGGTSPTGSSGLGQSNTLASAPGAVPITSSSSSQGSNNSNNNPVSLSMSPGRVGIGGSMGGPSMHSGTTSSLHHHGLATSPTRSFGSFPIAHNHNSSVHHHSYSSTSTSPTGSSANLGSNNTPSLSSSVGVGIPIGGSNNSLSPSSHSNTIGSGNGIGIAGSAGNGGGSLLSGTSPMVSATTGNQIGKTQIRRTSQSEGTSYMNVLPAAAGVAASSNMGGSSTADLAMSPPPRSGLANSITPDSLMDDEEEDEGTTITPGARGEDEQVEGMELQ